MSKRFTVIDHSADTGVKCTGESREVLFEVAAEGMFSILTDLNSIADRNRYAVALHADTYENLLMAWLQELLYLFSTKHFLFSKFSTSIQDTPDKILSLYGSCNGEPVDLDRHIINTEIKSVTYHQLTVQHSEKHWKARVIFDI